MTLCERCWKNLKYCECKNAERLRELEWWIIASLIVIFIFILLRA